MAFSTILGIGKLALGAYQSFQANRRAKEQLEMQREIMDRQFERAMEFANDAREKREIENAYVREREILDRQAAELERERQLEVVDDYQTQLEEERDYMLDRQRMGDRAAKEMQDFYRRQLARNQRIREDERGFAEEFLLEARDRAASERAEDIERFLETKDLKADEREFYLNELQKLQNQVNLERRDDMRIRDRVMGGARDLQDRLERVAAGLGDIPDIPVLTRDMIDAETARRQSEYQQDVDRAATAMASVGEADLVRSGMDLSSAGTARRGDITGRIADAYRGARNAAYDDAMKYITGVTGEMASNVNNIMDRRQQILAEEAGIGATELGYLQNLPSVRSATGPMERALNAPSAVYDRPITSANYQSPVGMTSAFYDGGALPSGIGASLPISSAASTQGLNISSGTVKPYNQTLDDPASYFTAATGAENKMLSSLAGERNRNLNTVDSFSENLGDFASGLGADLDTIMKDKYGGNFGQMWGARPSWLGGAGGWYD